MLEVIAKTGKPHWYAEGDELVNDGFGAYATTEKDYCDFELLLEFFDLGDIPANPEVADDFSLAILQRKLGGQCPGGMAFRMEFPLDFSEDRLAGLHDERLIGQSRGGMFRR